ncbi:MAG TPA: methyltransferase domain-containing protein [Allosphingosinicella sp.]|nr:methyltransferase domain-containing protein [Allosphingosinicella sp.]
MADEEAEIRQLLEEWNRTLVAKEVEAARRLRDADYVSAMPGGGIVNREEEIALLSSPDVSFSAARLQEMNVSVSGDEAVADVETYLDGSFRETPVRGLFRQRMKLRRRDGVWRVTRCEAEDVPFDEVKASGLPPASTVRRLARRLPARARRWLKGKVNRLTPNARAAFQDVAYLPYRPGEDYVLPPNPPTTSESGGLPIPPTELWLGYNYPAHGKDHVARMLDIVAASGFTFAEGMRILDLGCGAGRMIRHLEHLAGTCEIWGTDISAEHIFWCKQHLSPPFHFATTTKVPHLPFEDRSFDFIYCGSLFTHIDDLAEAWLLELHRILAPRGRLFVTIHDEHTVRLLETTAYGKSAVIREVRATPTYQAAKDSFGMLTVGRDNESQVFYHSAFLAKLLNPMFDTLSVTPEAYFYQTAYLLGRRERRRAQ